MALAYEIEDGIVHTKLAGTEGAEDQIELSRAWLADPNLPSPLLVCRDQRNATAATPNDVRKLVAYLTTVAVPPGSRLAIVVRDDANFGMSRMYQARTGGFDQLEVEVFRSKKEAVAWLREGSGPPPA